MMNELSLLIKPVGSRCDLACSYCFYKQVPQARAKKHL